MLQLLSLKIKNVNWRSYGRLMKIVTPFFLLLVFVLIFGVMLRRDINGSTIKVARLQQQVQLLNNKYSKVLQYNRKYIQVSNRERVIAGIILRRKQLVWLFELLSKKLPVNIVLRSVVLQGQKVTLEGKALQAKSLQRLVNLLEHSRLIKGTVLSLGKNSVSSYCFKLKFSLHKG